MKTAISVPDNTFERASRCAKALGVSRSEFFSQAAVRYLDELDNESLTEQINQALATPKSSDDSTVDAVGHGHRLLIDVADEW